MGFFNSMNVSASGLTAQQVRMDIISQNIANAETTRTENGAPYKRKVPLFQERSGGPSFSTHFGTALNAANSGKGVRVSQIVEDQTEGTKVYDPGHPDADAEGYVTKPNVNIVTEMVNLISSSRSYEANITAMNATKAMVNKTLELGR